MSTKSVEAKSGRRVGPFFLSAENDRLPFLHKKVGTSSLLEALLRQPHAEFDTAFITVSPETHFSLKESSFWKQMKRNSLKADYYSKILIEASLNGIYFDASDVVDYFDDSDVIVPRKDIRRKTKKLTQEQLKSRRFGTKKRKGTKKTHKKTFEKRNFNSTPEKGKGQPFDIVVHIKVNEE